MEKLITAVPFSGFYNTIHGDLFDRELEHDTDYFSHEVHVNKEAADLYISEMQDCVDWQKAHEAYAKDYVELFNEYFEGETGVKLDLEFESLESPKFYNYSNDRIFAYITPEKLKEVYQAAKKSAFAERIKERFTSYDGFASFYSNDIEQWPDDVLEFDHNEIETLLQAFLPDNAQSTDLYIEGYNGEGGEYIWGAISELDKCYLNALHKVIDDGGSLEAAEAVIQANIDARLPMKGEVAIMPA